MVRVLLHTDRATLEGRIASHDIAPDHPEVTADTREFRRSKVEPYFRAHREWSGTWADLTVDTAGSAPQEVAESILRALPALGVHTR